MVHHRTSKMVFQHFYYGGQINCRRMRQNSIPYENELRLNEIELLEIHPTRKASLRNLSDQPFLDMLQWTQKELYTYFFFWAFFIFTASFGASKMGLFQRNCKFYIDYLCL